MDIQAALDEGEDDAAVGAGSGASPGLALALPPTAVASLSLEQIKPTLESKAIDKLARTYGGREGVLDLLLNVEDAPADAPASRVMALLLDPANDGRSLGLICKLAGVSFGTLMRSIQSGHGAAAVRQSMNAIHRELEAVTVDVVRHARPHEVICGSCSGEGMVLVSAAKPAKGKQRRPVPAVFAECKPCRGKGTMLAPADLANQKLVLEIAGVHKKGAHSRGNQLILNQQLNQSVKVRGEAAGVLDQVKTAASRVIYRQGEVVDAQVVRRTVGGPAPAAAAQGAPDTPHPGPAQPPAPPKPAAVKPPWKR